jgi:hypothetical protein
LMWEQLENNSEYGQEIYLTYVPQWRVNSTS